MAPVLGTGPVYFAAGAYNPEDRSTMQVISSTNPRSQGAGTGWGIAKTLIVMRRTLRQPLLLRGQRVDGPGELGFAGHAGRRPYAALQFKTGWHTINAGRFRADGFTAWATVPGCYALQIDGRTFSRVVVFRIAFS